MHVNYQYTSVIMQYTTLIYKKIKKKAKVNDVVVILPILSRLPLCMVC